MVYKEVLQSSPIETTEPTQKGARLIVDRGVLEQAMLNERLPEGCCDNWGLSPINTNSESVPRSAAGLSSTEDSPK